jgi:hypothetical protein
VTEPDSTDPVVRAYRRGRLSFLQYVRQALPYAGPADRPLLDRVLALADAEAADLDRLAERLDERRVVVSHLGAFPSVFTNYNFVAIRKLLPRLREDQARGLAELERDAAGLPPGHARTWLEELAEKTRMHQAELDKLMA